MMVKISDLATGAYWSHMGMKTVTGHDGKLKPVMELTENVKQYYGIVHGGAIAGLLDTAMAVEINQQLNANRGAITIEMKLNYIRPVSDGTLWGEAKVLHQGKKTVVVQGEVKDDQGNLVAASTATFLIITVDN